MTETNCLICLEPKAKLLNLSCSCIFCTDCLVAWILAKITDPHYQIDQGIICMKNNCKTLFNIQDIRLQLSENSLEVIDDALLQVYIRNGKDVRRCPTENCPYAGVIQTSGTCKESFECEVCFVQWREKSSISKTELLKDFLTQQNHCKNEVLNHFWKSVNTKKCPNCKVKIEKNEGCDHMTCRQCSYEFCWICSSRHPSHYQPYHAYHNNKKQILAGILLPIITIIVLYLLYQIPFVATIAHWTIFPVVTFIKNWIVWILVNYWEVGVVIVLDIWCRVLVTAKNIRLVGKIIFWIPLIAVCWGVAYFLSTYQRMIVIAVAETVCISFIQFIRNLGKPSFLKGF